MNTFCPDVCVTMAKVHILTILFLQNLTFVSTTTLAEQFYHDAFFDGKTCLPADVKFSSPAPSLAMCVTLCKGDSCGSFFYAQGQGMCYGCTGSYTSAPGILPILAGTLYYSDRPVLECRGSEKCTTSVNGYRLCDGGGTGVCDVTKGRLEVLYDGQWGTVCNDNWSSMNNLVACRALGYITGFGTSYGQGSVSQPVNLDNVICTGTEASLSECAHNPWTVNDCGHDEDIGVECLACLGDDSCTTGVNNFRLCDGGGAGRCTRHTGRLEVFHDGVWGTVCNDDWHISIFNAVVACRTIGYRGGSYMMSEGSESQPIFLDNTECTGSEYRLTDCQHNDWGDTNCGHDEDIGITCVACDSPSGCTNAVNNHRLCGGGEEEKCLHDRGRLEVFHDGEWGTVCDDKWDEYPDNAQVACRGAGFFSGVITNTMPSGQEDEPIWLDNVMCIGDESTLDTCTHNGWGENNCNHTEDAGVVCT